MVFRGVMTRWVTRWERYKQSLLEEQLKSQFKRIGENFHVEWPVCIRHPECVSLGSNGAIASGAWFWPLKKYNKTGQVFVPEIVVGNDTYIGNNSHVVATNRVVIGNNIIIAPRVYISDNLHEYKDVSCSIQENTLLSLGEVHIGDESWIGENVCIFGNVAIGRHCVIGANSVVTKSVPDYSVAVGAPARIVKQYDASRQVWVGIQNQPSVSKSMEKTAVTVS